MRFAFTLGCTLLALGTGGFRLADKGLGLDEAASAAFAWVGPDAWFADHNMALYYALLGGWVRVFGSSELALRVPSLLCFAAGVPVAGMLASALYGAGAQRPARNFMLLYALSPPLIQFAQEARGYALELLLLMLAGALLLRVHARPSWSGALLGGAALGLAPYAHMFAAWLGLVFGTWVVWSWFERHPARLQLSAALALSGILVLPLVAAAAHSGGQQISWIYPPSLRGVWETLVWFGGGLPTLAELALIAWFALRAPVATRRWVLAWLLVPLLGSWGFSWLVQPIAHPKYLIVIMPAWLLAVAGGIEQVTRVRTRNALLTALLLTTLPRLDYWYNTFQKERWREAVALISAQLRAGDGIALDVLGAEAFDYYVVRSGAAQRWPRALYPDRSWAFPCMDEREAPVARLAAAPRLWLVRNRSQRALSLAQRLVWQTELIPHDGDDASIFADSQGRLISIQLYERRD